MIENVFVKVSMSGIQNYNCDAMCCQRYCSERYTHFCEIVLNGVELHLAMCEKHAEEFEENAWKVASLASQIMWRVTVMTLKTVLWKVILKTRRLSILKNETLHY